MEAAWKGILTEAERVSDVHLKVKENLCVGEIQQIKCWQKDNYHKVSIEVNGIFCVNSLKNVNVDLTNFQISEHASNKGAQGDGGFIQKSTETMGKAFGESRKNQSRLSRCMQDWKDCIESRAKR